MFIESKADCVPCSHFVAALIDKSNLYASFRAIVAEKGHQQQATRHHHSSIRQESRDRTKLRQMLYSRFLWPSQTALSA